MNNEGGTTSRQRVGLSLAGLLSIGNVISVSQPTPSGETGPPMVVLVACAVLGLIGLGGSLYAWRTGDRRTLRVVAGVIVLMALLAMPAFFAGVPAGIQVLVGVVVLVSIASCVLMLQPGRTAVAS